MKTRAQVALIVRNWAQSANPPLAQTGTTWRWLYGAIADGVVSALDDHDQDGQAHGGLTGENFLQKSNNLNDVSDPVAARENLQALDHAAVMRRVSLRF